MSTILASTKNPPVVISALHSADPGAGYDGIISPRILLSTIGLCGISDTYTRALGMVVMESQSIPNIEKQAYGQIQRISQNHPKIFTYCLVWSDSEIETKVIRRKNARSILGLSTCSVDTGEHLALNVGYGQIGEKRPSTMCSHSWNSSPCWRRIDLLTFGRFDRATLWSYCEVQGSGWKCLACNSDSDPCRRQGPFPVMQKLLQATSIASIVTFTDSLVVVVYSAFKWRRPPARTWPASSFITTFLLISQRTRTPTLLTSWHRSSWSIFWHTSQSSTRC